MSPNEPSKRGAWIVLACVLLVLIAVLYVKFNNENRLSPRHMRAQVNADLHNLYLACRQYWADTNPANACTADIYSSTAYGYIPAPHVVKWGKGGNQYDFNLKAKSLEADGVYLLEVKTDPKEPQDAQGKMKISRLE